MTGAGSEEFADAATWGGRPVARRIADAVPRGRVVVTGTICGAETAQRGGGVFYECTVDDGTGTLVAVFMGRASVPGLTVGARWTLEGTAHAARGRIEVLNPRYRLEA